MNARFTRLVTAFAGIALAVACSDSSTAPRHAATTPSFAATSDTGGGGGGTQVFHFVANGDNGYVNWYNFTGDTLGGFRVTFGSLNVGRGGSTNNPQAFLDYYVYEYGCDVLWNCFYNLVSAGYGLIPAKDLGGGGKQLRLQTNTANNPNFFVYAGVGGLVLVNWHADGFFQSSSSGTSSYRYGSSYTHRSQGSATVASAIVSGSVVGVPLGTYPTGGFGSNHNVSIDIYR